MSIDLCILASGSAGNCSVLRTPAGAILIDAGIGPRTAAKRLVGTGLGVEEIRSICLTHLDRDHFSPTWLNTLARLKIRVYCHRRSLRNLSKLAAELHPDIDWSGQITGFDHTCFEPLSGLRFSPIPLAHDVEGSHGFVVEGFGCRAGYATDLGQVPPELIHQFVDLDILALESNYDPQKQLESPRPEFLKQRIMGGAGHLSNEQALSAIGKILDGCTSKLPVHIVLLHRSRQCNCPKLLRRLAGRDQRIAPRLTLAEQHQRSDWLRASSDVRPLDGEQLSMGWS
jgi:phosphoribosyl 1,2-cyclic phosphodiesterase